MRGDPNSLRVAVKSLGRGVYTVTWRVVSRADGHATAGAFAFGVGQSPAGASSSAVIPKAPGLNPVEIAGRWAFITGVMMALGGAAVGLLVFRDERPAAYMLIGAVVALAGVVVLAIGQQRESSAAFGAFLRTAIGRALVWRAAFVVAGIVAALFRRRAAFIVVALTALAAIYTEVAAGHAAAASSYRWPAIATQCAHFAAAAVWMGGLGAVLVGVRGEPSVEKAAAIKRFSTLAGAGLAVVAGTGTYRAVVQIGRWNALWSSGYGIVVLAKTALLGVLALLGARNRYTNIPQTASNLRGFRRVSRGELGVVIAVVVATAVLTALSPPPPAAVAEAAAPLTASGFDLGHTYRVRLEVLPGYAGPNTFRVHVDDYETKRSVRVNLVSLRFELAEGTAAGPSTLALRKNEGDLWRGSGTNLSLDGRWTVTAVVQGSDTSAEVPMHIATRCRTQVLSPGPPTIFTEQLGGGNTAQTYLDPGKAGYNEVHFTFFDAKGNELPIPTNPAITATKPGADAAPLDVRRFSAGHFIASGTLASGKWRFESAATPRGGKEPLRACFEQTI